MAAGVPPLELPLRPSPTLLALILLLHGLVLLQLPSGLGAWSLPPLLVNAAALLYRHGWWLRSRRVRLILLQDRADLVVAGRRLPVTLAPGSRVYRRYALLRLRRPGRLLPLSVMLWPDVTPDPLLRRLRQRARLLSLPVDPAPCPGPRNPAPGSRGCSAGRGFRAVPSRSE